MDSLKRQRKGKTSRRKSSCIKAYLLCVAKTKLLCVAKTKTRWDQSLAHFTILFLYKPANTLSCDTFFSVPFGVSFISVFHGVFWVVRITLCNAWLEELLGFVRFTALS